MSQTRAQLLKGFSNTSASDDAITVDSSGQVGIGKTSPAGLLHISKSGGNAKLLIQRSNTASNTNDYGSILWQSSAGNNNAAIGVARHSAENDGYMFFSTASGGSLQEELRIQSGGGISFNGDTAATNALDDYEEGDWTPSMHSGGWTGFSIQSAKYVKIGALVFVQCYVSSLTGSGNSVALELTSLPFNSVSNGYTVGSVDFGEGSVKGVYARTESNSNKISFFYPSESNSTSRVSLKGNQIGDAYIILGLTYFTND